jgi:hypothetical protein
VFYTGRPIHELATSADSADQSPERARDWDRKPRLLPADFAKLHPDANFITTEQYWQELQRQLPGRYQIVEYAPYFLRDKNLLLARPTDSEDTAELGGTSMR